MSSRIFLRALSVLLVFSAVTAAPTAAANNLIDFKTISAQGTDKAPSSFSIKQVKNPKYTPQLVNTTDLYLGVLHKYKARSQNHRYRRSNPAGSVLSPREYTFTIAGSFADTGYQFPIQLGTPQQTLYVTFDTGSPDIWVFSDQMPASETSGHAVYSANMSSTSQLMAGQSFSATYGGGTATGNVYTDIISIGAVYITGYPIETATDASSEFVASYSSDGIWGMDMATAEEFQSPVIATTWMEILNDNDITMYSINFVYFGAGTVTFGDLDSTQYTGSVTYTSVYTAYDTFEPFWAVKMTSYSVGTGTSTSFSQGAILDTGTSFTYLPDAIVDAYWAQVANYAQDSDGNYWFPCNATLPDLHIGVKGGATMTLHGRYLNPYGLGYMDPDYYCEGGLQSSDGVGLNVFGQAIFQSMFVVMDYGGSRVGFATKTLLD